MIFQKTSWSSTALFSSDFLYSFAFAVDIDHSFNWPNCNQVAPYSLSQVFKTQRQCSTGFDLQP